MQFNNCFLDVLEDKFDATIQKIEIHVEANFVNQYPVNNIVASNRTILGNDSCIVVCAHYDHLGKMGQNTTFYGANDNASGVAMLLDLAQKFNEKEYRIVGEKTGKSYRLGDEVMIKVAGINLEERKMDLELVQ